MALMLRILSERVKKLLGRGLSALNGFTGEPVSMRSIIKEAYEQMRNGEISTRSRNGPSIESWIREYRDDNDINRLKFMTEKESNTPWKIEDRRQEVEHHAWIYGQILDARNAIIDNDNPAFRKAIIDNLVLGIAPYL